MTTEHEFHFEKVSVPDSDAVVYRFHGVMGESQHCYEFQESFLEDLTDLPGRIVFNLGNLDNMYSSGIGIVANCFTKAAKAGKSLVVAAVPPVIHRTLTITGIEPMMKEYASEEEALAASVE